MDRQIRILLADGNEEFCGRLKQTLEENENFTVVGMAADGERACELLQTCRPDILALDLMLPKADGIAVLKKARELERAPQALVMTGFMTEYVGTMAAELGVQYFMSKPCDCQAVADRIAEITAGSERPRCAGMRPISRHWSRRSSTRSASRRTSRAISTYARPS
ncbi:MAG: response regulator [Oscillospiraceae bacterium]